MKGDFSRDSFDPMKNFTRVLQQQGRVQLDADWNEQVSIFWHHWRMFIKDLIGPYGGPEDNCGFGIVTESNQLPNTLPLERKNELTQLLLQSSNGDFLIGPGSYYVDGIRCNNVDFALFSKQTGGSKLSDSGEHLVYLDVWEREITGVEDDSFREVALGGRDTCIRTQVEWQVRSKRLDTEPELTTFLKRPLDKLRKEWESEPGQIGIPNKYGFKSLMNLNNRGRLRVKLNNLNEGEHVTTATDDARYHGGQNQLYRVEIHEGTKAASATFKWSRENGSVVLPILSGQTQKVTVGHFTNDSRASLRVGDWVEIINDDHRLKNLTVPLRQVDGIDTSKGEIQLKGQPLSEEIHDRRKHPLMRRWDQKQGDGKKGGVTLRDGAAILREGEWLTLENGIQIEFVKNTQPTQEHNYQSGDYWLSPARVTTGGVLWPLVDQQNGSEPHGINHHFAPLAIVDVNGGGKLTKDNAEFRPMFGYYAG